MPSGSPPASNVESPERKLAAILCADIAGYSTLMGHDEAATVRTLSEYRAVVRTCVDDFNGKIDDAKGDAILAEFASPVNAVSCAVEVQRQLGERNADLPTERRMHLRIGVNLGDVIVQDDTVYGDGVNIAARLESVAEPGRICISRTVYDQIKNKLPLTYESLGKKVLKNIAEPIEVFRVVPSATSATPKTAWRRPHAAWRGALLIGLLILVGSVVFTLWQPNRLLPNSAQLSAKRALVLPEQPSIVVLPFTNFGGNPEDAWFIDGITETLITDLSRLRNLFVIARNSAFTYKGKSVDVRQVGEQLGVRYVLEGSVQRTGDRLRVNVQLIEAATGRHIWAERYDRKVADLFEMQDDLTDNIVTELNVKLLDGEIARSWRKGTRNRAAYDLLLRGEDAFYAYTQDGFARAQALFQEAVKLDPKFAIGWVWLGWTHFQQGDAGWSPDPGESYRKAEALARRAIEIDPTSGEAYVLVATVLTTLERHAEAVTAADRALALRPNHADTVINAGWVLAQNGRAAEAVLLMERGLRLDPIPQDYFYGGLGDSLLLANRAEESIPYYRRCVERIPDFIWCQLGLAAAYAELGNLEDARVHAKEALRINSKITATANTYVRSIGIPADRARILAAFRKAGLE